MATAQDLALKKSLSVRDLTIIVAVFALSHLSFWLLSFLDKSTVNVAEEYFDEMGLAGPLLPALISMLTVVILAPVCEELLFRGMILRPFHDSFARKGRATLGAIIGIAVSSFAFALPSAGASASIIHYILVFGCPVFVFFIARLLAQVLPQSSRATHSL